MPQTKCKELPHYVEYNVYIRVSEKVSEFYIQLYLWQYHLKLHTFFN